MITMDQVNNIKYLTRTQGLPYSEVKKITGCAYETIKKYEEMENLTPEFKTPAKRPTKLDDFKDIIRKWIMEDKGRPYKQRHTARRVHARLTLKYPQTYTASYRTLAKHLTQLKKELNFGKEEYLKLSHSEVEAQVDFGKLTFFEKGKEVKGSYLVLTLPYSNAGFVQLFRGETQECLLEGLKNIFGHMGRVPSKIWFDNLSAAVKVINKKERKLNKFFESFCAHYSFKPVFCNPASGNEKGNVENKVGYFRRNYLVPEPRFNDINSFNKQLLTLCDNDHKRLHYEKKEEISKLYGEQLSHMQKVNPKEFEVFRIEKRKANKYGNVEVETNVYSVSPTEKNSELWIKIEANILTVFDEKGIELIRHHRCFDKYKTIISYNESLPLIIQKINALENTEFYQTLPKIWKDFLKDKDKEQKRRILQVLGKMLLESSIEVATAVLQDAIVAGTMAPDSILIIFHRYMDCEFMIEELDTLPENAPKIEEYEIDLNRYDKFLGGQGK
ncbi:MAG: IS21 family transposase [Cetobacterium sp.]